MHQLTELQLDALKEACSMGTAHAATAVSKLVKRRVDMCIPDVRLIQLKDVPETVGNREERVVGIYCRILGEISGGFVLTFPIESAFALCGILLDRHTSEFGDIENSVMQEVGSIIAGAYVNLLAKVMNKTLMISVPRLAVDMAGAVIDVVLINIAEVADEVVVMKIVFTDETKAIQGKFFILPDPGSLDIMINSIQDAAKA